MIKFSFSICKRKKTKKYKIYLEFTKILFLLILETKKYILYYSYVCIKSLKDMKVLICIETNANFHQKKNGQVI